MPTTTTTEEHETMTTNETEAALSCYAEVPAWLVEVMTTAAEALEVWTFAGFEGPYDVSEQVRLAAVCADAGNEADAVAAYASSDEEGEREVRRAIAAYYRARAAYRAEQAESHGAVAHVALCARERTHDALDLLVEAEVPHDAHEVTVRYDALDRIAEVLANAHRRQEALEVEAAGFARQAARLEAFEAEQAPGE